MASELENLNLSKAAGSIPVYDPNMRAGAPQPDPAMLPQGAPASMAYSPLYNNPSAPQAATPGNTPAPAGGQEDTQALDKLEKTEKELQQIRDENIELKVEQRAREIAEKMDKGKPAAAPVVDSKPSPEMEHMKTRIADLRTTLQGIGKSASTTPVTPKPMTQRTATPYEMNTTFYDVGNRKLPNGAGGVQMPVTLHSVPFGQKAHQVGSFVRRSMFPVQPTARGTFTENNPTQIGWPQRIMGLIGAMTQQQAGPGAPPSAFSF